MFRTLIALSMSMALFWGPNSCCCTASHVATLVGKWFGTGASGGQSNETDAAPRMSCCTASSCYTTPDRPTEQVTKRDTTQQRSKQSSISKPLCCSIDTQTPCGCFHAVVLSNERSTFTGPSKADFDDFVVWLVPSSPHSKSALNDGWLRTRSNGSGTLASLPFRTQLQRWNC